MTLLIILFIMIDLDKIFHHVAELTGDVWVADYTEETKNEDKESRQGVVISSQPIGMSY